MALTLRKPNPIADTVYGNHRVKFRRADFSGNYTAGGLALTPADLGLRVLHGIEITPKSGYTFEYDRTTQKVKIRTRSIADLPIKVKDDDNAASAGVAVYVHIDEVLEQGSLFGHLEFVSPTNTDGIGLISAGGPGYAIQDDDNAASGGVALYIDEDAALGSRLLANIGNGRPAYIQVSDGRFVKVTHHATPSSVGVQVYFDEDAVNTYDRLRFVSPTNTDGAETTSGEMLNGTSIAALSDVEIKATGF